MENGTVTIPVEVYNVLRDFEKGIKEGSTKIIYRRSFLSSLVDNEEWLSNDETVMRLAEDKVRLQAEIRRLSCALKSMEQEQAQELKKMTYWQFRKWRNK